MTTYNRFVKRLASGRPPHPDHVAEVCAGLRKHLRQELRRRNLWDASPRLVGIVDQTWSDDALTELVHDAYVHSFVHRLHGLINQWRAGIDVSGLVRRNLRNFLTDRQKQIDPIGYLVFERTCKAALQAIEAGEVAILNAPLAAPSGGTSAVERGDLDGATLLRFGSGLAPEATEEQVAEIVPDWSGDLFPELVTAQTNAADKAIRKLARHLAGLREAGVQAFRLGHLVNALKRDLRRRWEAKVAEDLGEPGTEDGIAESPPTVKMQPEEDLDGEKRLAAIVRCVTRRIALLDPGELREQLWKIWPLVRTCVADGVPRPAWTTISRELGISRKRLPQLYDRLGAMVRRCLECLGRPLKAADEKDVARQNPSTRSAVGYCEWNAMATSPEGR